MSFEEEWAQHKEAGAQRAVQMRLNQTPDGDYRPGRQEPPGRKERLRITTGQLIDSSWGMLQLRDLTYNGLDALVMELSEQRGMAGDDDAGNALATGYNKVARTVVDKLSFVSLVMSGGAGALLDTAVEFLKNEDDTARRLLQATDSPSMGVAPQPSPMDCSPRPSRSGEELPEITGETGKWDRWVENDKFRGDPGKLRRVAGTWRAAQRLLVDAFHEAQGCWYGANLGQEGLTADAIEKFFKRFIGQDSEPPDTVSEDTELMANLPAACATLAKACDAYADHIESCRGQEALDRDPLLGGGSWNPLDNPRWGGNGEDGGLHDKVSGDAAITRLAHVAPALDHSQKRVVIPRPDPGPSLPGLPGFPLPLVRVPTLVPAAAFGAPKPGEPRRPPIGPPNPPDPRFPRLSPGEQKNFRTWLQSLNEGHISGGKPAEVAYQKRIAGYPEYEVPIPKGISPRSTLMVDGFRATDGMAVEAKFVNRPDEPCYRRVEDLRKSHNDGKKDFLYEKDRVELRKYAAALGDPRNKEMRGVETVTNNRESAPYWRVMMAAYGVKGYARYVP
ncbi:restriction endonuclease fold toxin-2 domain-containing protein [Streptomyces albus]|uniref:restriction endonuclease fold toxin-2 domain-containing protein n=1 Tax=Streptomyces albus TaxID=1888 RepID=UPI00056A75AC|nr:restriction endonuclease fold toxin-2 domain-containing protein [Streptomyces albus]